MVKVTAQKPADQPPQNCPPLDHALDFDVPVKLVTKAWADCARAVSAGDIKPPSTGAAPK